MAAVLTKLKGRSLGGGAHAVVLDLTFAGDTYVAGGQTPAPTLASFHPTNREPDLVLVNSWNGFKYEYDNVNKKIMIRQATTTGTNLPLAEHSGVAIVAGARTNIRLVAFWFPF